jgi:hypothetical protein
MSLSLARWCVLAGLSSLCLIVTAPAHAAVVPIPAKATGTEPFASLTIRKGRSLEFRPAAGRKGVRFMKRLRGREVALRCLGYTRDNNTWLMLDGSVKVARAATSVKARLTTPLVVYSCSIGPSFASMQQLRMRPPRPSNFERFNVLFMAMAQAIDAEIKLAQAGNKQPTPQQVIDQMLANRGYTPPAPLVALAGPASYPAPGNLGVWTDPKLTRVSETRASDGALLASVWRSGIR